MQKNKFCPLPTKVLVYEEIDSISQSIFNSKKNLFPYPIKTEKYISKNKAKTNKNHGFNKIIIYYLYIKYQNYFEKNYNIFSCNYLLKKYNNKNINKKLFLISKFYAMKDAKIIFPKREFYYRHHFEFFGRPNLINIYFNKILKESGLNKLKEYQSQKKKECYERKNEEKNEKIFDTGVLEELGNCSTTVTQASNNEKCAMVTPFEILRKFEDNKRLLQKEKEKVNEKDYEIKQDKDKDVKSKITFSESCISHHSKTIIDDSLLKIVKDISKKPKQYKPEEKRINKFFNKKKDITQKIVKLNKKINCIKYNVTQKVNCATKFIKKEIKKEKRTSTSTNKKNKKLIFDTFYQNVIERDNSKTNSLIKNISSNSKKKFNTNYPSFNLQNKAKGIKNLKKQTYNKKRHTIQFGYNLTNSINNINKNNSNLVSISINNIDDILKYILTPNDKKRYGDKKCIIKKQNKKNSALTVVNNVFNKISQHKISESEKKYKKIKRNNFNKSKSPLISIFNPRNEKSEENKSKKRKNVLYPEQHNSLIVKSLNFTNRKNLLRNSNKPYNAITLSQNFDSICYLK